MTDGSFSGQEIEFDLLPPDESLDSDLLGEDSDDDGPGYFHRSGGHPNCRGDSRTRSTHPRTAGGSLGA
jgi:hypothetical protein